jgi:hypothetical protein
MRKLEDIHGLLNGCHLDREVVVLSAVCRWRTPLANEMARIAWAMLTHGTSYEAHHVSNRRA